jgi:hypothetical protein
MSGQFRDTASIGRKRHKTKSMKTKRITENRKLKRWNTKFHGYDGGHIIPITNVKAELSRLVIVWQRGRYMNQRPLPYILIYIYDLLHSKIKYMHTFTITE